jgi:23S rRNA pseudouridine2605 synthase
MVNDKVCNDLSMMIKPGIDQVKVEGRSIAQEEEKIYIILNKPKGYIVTAGDPFGRKTIYDLIPDIGFRVFPVGRLDADSEGILLLTNDGETANRLIHPRFKLPKIYRVVVSGRVSKEQLKSLRDGIMLDGKMTQPARVFLKKQETSQTVLRMTISEGMNRQIRRMAEAVDLKVTSLKRLQFADVELGKLPTGMWRLLKPDEVLRLRKRTGQER